MIGSSLPTGATMQLAGFRTIAVLSSAAWPEIPTSTRDKYFREFPPDAIIDWHCTRGLRIA